MNIKWYLKINGYSFQIYIIANNGIQIYIK